LLLNGVSIKPIQMRGSLSASALDPQAVDLAQEVKRLTAGAADLAHPGLYVAIPAAYNANF